MIRKALMSLVAAAVLLLAGSTAMAQSANPAVQAVVAFTNLLDPAVVAELRGQYESDEEFANAILEALMASGVLSVETVTEMREAVATGVLRRETLIVFVADLASGTEPLATRDPVVLETQLQTLAPTVQIPQGSDGVLTSEEVGTFVAEVTTGGGSLLDSIAASYNQAITPRNAAEAG